MQENNTECNKSQSDMQGEFQPYCVESMVELFHLINEHHEAGQGRLPAIFYDRSQFGSKTALRYLMAQKQIIKETLVICEAIYRYGTTSEELEPEQRVIRFGLIFNIAEDFTDKLECILRFARKINLIDYEGEVLLQNVHNDVPIILKASTERIKADLHKRLEIIKDVIKAEGGEVFEGGVEPYQTPQELEAFENEDQIPVETSNPSQLIAQQMNDIGQDLGYKTMQQGQQKEDIIDLIDLTSTDGVEAYDLFKKTAQPLEDIFKPTALDTYLLLESEHTCGTANALDGINHILPQPQPQPQPLEASTDASVNEMLASQGFTESGGTKKNSTWKNIINWLTKPCIGSKGDE